VYTITADEIRKDAMPHTRITRALMGVGMMDMAIVNTQGSRAMAMRYPLPKNAAKDTVIEVGTIASRNATRRTTGLLLSRFSNLFIALQIQK
jgi:hypothetical protein